MSDERTPPPRSPSLVQALRAHGIDATDASYSAEQVFIGAMHRLDQITAQLSQLVSVAARNAEAVTRIAEFCERIERKKDEEPRS